jgi:F-type H+-transporting ATPase subunit b
MNFPRLPSSARRALRAVLPAAAVLLAAFAAFAAGEGEAHHGGAAVPWGEIVKQAVNFAILAGVLFFLLRKPVSSFLKERSEMLRKSIDDAANARAEAARKLAAIEERTAKLAEEIAQMNAKMDAESKVEAQALHDTATAEIARIRTQAGFTADQEVKKARQELQQEASLLSAQAAEALVRKVLSPEDQERLVRENIEKIEGVVR